MGKGESSMSFKGLRPTLLVAIVVAAAALSPARASAAPATPAFAPVGAYTIAPSPIAPNSSLSTGQSVALTLTVLSTAGTADPYAYVWLKVISFWPDGHFDPATIGDLLVNAPIRGTNGIANKYQVDRHGQLTMVYTAGSAPKPRYQDSVVATRFGGGGSPCPCTFDSYTY
jgi:hypothetical protein